MQMPNIITSASITIPKQFLRLSFWLNAATLIPLVLHKCAIWTGRVQKNFWGRKAKISNAAIDHNVLPLTDMNNNG